MLSKDWNLGSGFKSLFEKFWALKHFRVRNFSRLYNRYDWKLEGWKIFQLELCGECPKPPDEDYTDYNYNYYEDYGALNYEYSYSRKRRAMRNKHRKKKIRQSDEICKCQLNTQSSGGMTNWLVIRPPFFRSSQVAVYKILLFLEGKINKKGVLLKKVNYHRENLVPNPKFSKNFLIHIVDLII